MDAADVAAKITSQVRRRTPSSNLLDQLLIKRRRIWWPAESGDFNEWSMARVSLSDVDPQTKMVWPDFDPYSANGLMVMARIDELIAQGRVVDAPLLSGNG